MEALALGRPVISTNIAGVSELVRPGQTGWLVPPSSLDALVEVMQTVLEQPADALSLLGRKGAELVRQRHDIKIEVDKLLRLIQAGQLSRPVPAEQTDGLAAVADHSQADAARVR
jgi:glycosyltransferase involved in cell wall biosynthesis